MSVNDTGSRGNTLVSVFSGVSLAALLGAAVWLGGLDRTVDTHTRDQGVHESTAAKRQRIEAVVSDKLKPIEVKLDNIEKTLVRIEKKQDAK